MAKPSDREVGIPENSANSKRKLGDQFPGPAPQPGDGEGCGTMLLAGIMLGTVVGALARVTL